MTAEWCARCKKPLTGRMSLIIVEHYLWEHKKYGRGFYCKRCIKILRAPKEAYTILFCVSKGIVSQKRKV